VRVLDCNFAYHLVGMRTVDNAEQIRAAATKLFASQGYEGTSLQAIAERVGVTKQTLLYHYASKDALRRAVLEQIFEHWRERLPHLLEAVTSGHDRFEALTLELVRFFEADEHRAQLLLREMLDNPQEMRRLLGDNLRPWILLVAQYIRQGQQSHIIHDDLDPEAYVLHVIVLVLSNGALHGAARNLLGQGSSDAAQRQRAELFRLTRTALFTRARTATEDA
jgi:TetR/AcrR family transcriptional regulator